LLILIFNSKHSFANTKKASNINALQPHQLCQARQLQASGARGGIPTSAAEEKPPAKILPPQNRQFYCKNLEKITHFYAKLIKIQ
jgi:hypothetical protein